MYMPTQRILESSAVCIHDAENEFEVHLSANTSLTKQYSVDVATGNAQGEGGMQVQKCAALLDSMYGTTLS